MKVFAWWHSDSKKDHCCTFKEWTYFVHMLENHQGQKPWHCPFSVSEVRNYLYGHIYSWLWSQSPEIGLLSSTLAHWTVERRAGYRVTYNQLSGNSPQGRQHNWEGYEVSCDFSGRFLSQPVNLYVVAGLQTKHEHTVLFLECFWSPLPSRDCSPMSLQGTVIPYTPVACCIIYLTRELVQNQADIVPPYNTLPSLPWPALCRGQKSPCIIIIITIILIIITISVAVVVVVGG